MGKAKFIINLDKINKIDFDPFLEKIKNIDSTDKDWYHEAKVTKSYSNLIKFTKFFLNSNDSKKSKNLEQTLTGLVHMAYGWMPTIVNCNFKSFAEKYKETFWNKVENGDKDFINDLMPCITGNNGTLINDYENKNINDESENKPGSIVGTSKLLHFLNPTKYAIYDSRIYLSISKNKTSSNYNNIDYYISYLTALKNYINTPNNGINDIFEKLKEKGWINQGDSYLRLLDLIFWLDKGRYLKF